MKAFDEIGESWDKAHPEPMPIAKTLASLVKKKGIVLDAGCGTGRHFALLSGKAIKVYGIDSSSKMIELAKRRASSLKKVEVLEGDFTKLPFENDFFDFVFYFASLHHLKVGEQEEAFQEMHRVLKKGGMAFVTVWSKYQKRFKGVKKEALIGFDYYGRRAKRYYYFFDEDELKSLAVRAGLRVKEIFFEDNGEKTKKLDSRNICLIAEK
ncbi:MAG: class I SAM-dependent methyltransferase [Candidatus Micrarchaeota archaeon]